MKLYIFITLFLLDFSMCIYSQGKQSSISPFEKLENKFKSDEKNLIQQWHESNSDKRKIIENSLKDLYENWHNIRHYKAFGEILHNFQYSKEKISVLYPASGAHIAPFEIFHNGNFNEINFIFTEIDVKVIPRLEILLNEMLKEGFYKNLSSKIFPLENSKYSKIQPPAVTSSQDIIKNWVEKTIKETGEAPPIKVIFSFEFKKTIVNLYLIFKGNSIEKGSTDYYRAEDYAKVDLLISHDISFDPRENLAFLKSFIDSACILNKKKISVIIEDLENYPQPLDLSLFNIVKRTNKSYGHSSFFKLPDGNILETEGDFSLYEGAVLLEPNLELFCKLNNDEKNIIFNLILFKDYVFYRKNYDLIDEKKIPAPILLDLYKGFGYKDIEENDISKKRDFLLELSKKSIEILKNNKDFFLNNWLCISLKNFKNNMQEIIDNKEKFINKNFEKNNISNLFLISENTKKTYKKALQSQKEIEMKLENDKIEIKKALSFLNSINFETNLCRKNKN